MEGTGGIKMLKKEIAKLIEQLKDDDSIDDVISKSDLGKTLSTNGLTLETFKGKILSDSVFKSYMDSENEKHFSKALETWKNNNLQKLIDDEYKKKYPKADPKDTELTSMKAEIEQMKKEKLRESLTNKALKVATEKKLPIELIDFIVGEDETATNKNLETLAAIFSKRDENLKAELLKDNSYVPPKGKETITNNPWSKEHYNLTAQGKILKENPELANKYMVEAK